MTNPKVTAVVLNFRTPEVALACVQQLCQQQGVDLGVALVDNCSGDHSAEFLAAGVKEQRQIRFIPSENNSGFARGNNLGARAFADSDYFLICNPDIVVNEPATVLKLITALTADPEAHVASPAVISPKAGVQGPYIAATPARFILNQLFPPCFRFIDREAQASLEPMRVHRGIGAFFVVRGSSFRAVDFFDPATFLYFEEEILVEKLKRRFHVAQPWLYVPTVAVTHRDESSSTEQIGLRRWNRFTAESAAYYFRHYLGAGPLTLNLLRVSDKVRRYFWSGLVYWVRRKRP